MVLRETDHLDKDGVGCQSYIMYFFKKLESQLPIENTLLDLNVKLLMKKYEYSEMLNSEGKTNVY